MSAAARGVAREFFAERFARYAEGRNADAASGLSPYLHFGHVGVDDAGFVDRLGGGLAFALRFHREVDHHDRVLLYDAHQHDDADEGIHVELDPERHQSHERAQARGRQSRQNRERVDEALVEDAQNEVDHENGQEQQDAHAFERALERLRGALERRVDGRRHLHRGHCLVDFLDRLGQ